MSRPVEVIDLRTAKTIGTWTCSPEEAVVSAYAMSQNDHNTWEYPRKYLHLLSVGSHTVACGDFVALRGRSDEKA